VTRKKGIRDVTVFTKDACIGFEELCREFLAANILGKKQVNKPQARDFTCKCESMTAHLLFLEYDLIFQMVAQLDILLIEQIFKERKGLIEVSLNNLGLVSNKIAGSAFKEDEPSIEIKQVKIKKNSETKFERQQTEFNIST